MIGEPTTTTTTTTTRARAGEVGNCYQVTSFLSVAAAAAAAIVCLVVAVASGREEVGGGKRNACTIKPVDIAQPYYIHTYYTSKKTYPRLYRRATRRVLCTVTGFCGHILLSSSYTLQYYSRVTPITIIIIIKILGE